MCLDRGTSFRIIETTSSICSLMSTELVIRQLINFLREENMILRRITMTTIEKICIEYGLREINE